MSWEWLLLKMHTVCAVRICNIDQKHNVVCK